MEESLSATDLSATVTSALPQKKNLLTVLLTGIVSKLNTRKSRLKNMVNILKFKFKPGMIVSVVGVLVLCIISFYLGMAYGTKRIVVASDQRVAPPLIKANQTINKTFLFPLKDDKGQEVSKVKYTIENAELEDTIIINGQKATAVKGKTFLVINLKLVNDYKNGIEINTRDYIRLAANKKGDKLAPDIHNDPVKVQAISTKLTRLGFPINDSDKDLQLEIGEINGKKDTIRLDLK